VFRSLSLELRITLAHLINLIVAPGKRLFKADAAKLNNMLHFSSFGVVLTAVSSPLDAGRRHIKWRNTQVLVEQEHE
jgi:hypothetical protein